MSQSPVPDWRKPIPLFPLQHCVLLPHATIPLHIFEPRYRAMMASVLDSHGLIAMATFEGDAWMADYQGKPPIRPCVCVGLVVRHEKLPDGRYNLLLQGLARARVAREPPHDPYRVAMLEPVEPRTPMEIDLDDLRRTLEALLGDPGLTDHDGVAAVRNIVSGEIPTAVLIDLAALACMQDNEQRYAMLAEPDAAARGRMLVRWLRHARAAAAGEPTPLWDDEPGLN